VLVAPGDGDDEAVVGGDEGGAGGGAGAEGVLVEGPAVEGAGHGHRVVVQAVGQEGGDGGGELRRGEGQAREEGGEDGGGGGAGGDGGGQLPAQPRGQVALGQQAGAAAGAERARQGALLGGGEDGAAGGGRGWRGHAGSGAVWSRVSLPTTQSVPGWLARRVARWGYGGVVPRAHRPDLVEGKRSRPARAAARARSRRKKGSPRATGRPCMTPW